MLIPHLLIFLSPSLILFFWVTFLLTLCLAFCIYHSREWLSFSILLDSFTFFWGEMF